jgi:hypothetical protein
MDVAEVFQLPSAILPKVHSPSLRIRKQFPVVALLYCGDDFKKGQ